MFNFIKKPHERLEAAIANARKPRPDLDRQAADLWQSIRKDAIPTMEEGFAPVVFEAYEVLADLQIRLNQPNQAVLGLEEMSRLQGGLTAALGLALRVLAVPDLSEPGACKLAGWLSNGGRLGEAVSSLRTLVDEHYPRSAPLAECLADGLVQAGEHAEAAERYKTVMELRHEDGERLLPKLEALAEAAPNLSLPLRLLGQVHAEARRYGFVASSLQRAAAQEPLDVEHLFLLADAYLALEKPAEAVDAFGQILQHRGAEAELLHRCARWVESYPEKDALYCRCQCIWGDIFLRQSRPDEALPHFQVVLENLPSAEGRELALALTERLPGLAKTAAQPNRVEAYLALARAHQILKEPNPTLEAYSAAYREDHATAQQVMAGLKQVYEQFPKHLPSRLEYVRVAIDQELTGEAFAAVESIRRDFSSEKPVIRAQYELLLHALEKTGSDSAMAVSDQGPIFLQTLYALAEENGIPNPQQSLSYLRRLLDVFGPPQADSVLAQLEFLGLLDRTPGEAWLLAGDAEQSAGRLEKARFAYLKIPFSAASLPVISQRLEQLASQEPENCAALFEKGRLLLQAGQPEDAVAVFRRAFTCQPEAAAPLLVQELEPPAAQPGFTLHGLDLLADAHLQISGETSLRRVCEVARLMFQVDPTTGDLVLSKCQRVSEQADPQSANAYQAGKLQAEIFSSLEKFDQAALAFGSIIRHPAAEEDFLVQSLAKLIERAPSCALAWLALGDLQFNRKKPQPAEGLGHYNQALKLDPPAISPRLLERLDGLRLDRKELQQNARLLKADCFAYVKEDSRAAAELHSVLSAFGKPAIDPLLASVNLLPDGGPAWLLRSEAEMLRPAPDAALPWFLRIVEQGARAELEQAEAALGQAIQTFPRHAGLRLAHARALIRLEQVDQAIRSLGDTAAGFPDVRAEALVLLDKLNQATGSPDAWLATARGKVAEDDVPGAVQALGRAWVRPDLMPTAYDLLNKLAKKHNRDPQMLGALVGAEVLQGTLPALEKAAGHAEQWLQVAPAQAGQLLLSLPQAVSRLEETGEGSSSLALRLHLLWADASQAAGQADQAANQLRAVTQGWSAQQPAVLERCQRWLEQGEALPLRLVMVDTLLSQELYRSSLEAVRNVSYQDVVACQALVERCTLIYEGCQQTDPILAAQALLVRGHWQVQLQDAHAAAESGRSVVAQDSTQVDLAARWLLESGWDEESRDIFAYAAAGIYCSGGEPWYSSALAILNRLLDDDFENAASPTLEAAARFDPAYWPAWELRLRIWMGWAADRIEPLEEGINQLLEQFGPAHNPQLMEILTSLDPAQSRPYFIRARVYQAGDYLQGAVDELLALQQALPDELPKVKQTLDELVNQHPQAILLRLAKGDLLRQAGEWQEALLVYRQVEQDSPESHTGLVERARLVLAALPQEAEAYWLLARLYTSLEEPQSTAGVLDILSDVDEQQAQPAQLYLEELVKIYPDCAYAWYVLGKLTYRCGDSVKTIGLLERALAETPPVEVTCPLHSMLGRSYLQERQLESALMNIRQAVRLAPQDTGLRQTLLTVRLAMLDEQILQAEAHLQQSRGSTASTLNLARLLVQRGRARRAVTLLQEALRFGGQERELHLELGRCFYSLQQPALAAASLEQSLASAEGELPVEDRKDALYLLAQCRRSLLMFPEALQALEQIAIIDIDYRNVVALVEQVEQEQAAGRQLPLPLRLLHSRLPAEGE